jgi:type II secretory pathway pseudopilin PulG
MSVAVATTIGGAPRVNLMPKAEAERRERSALVARWGGMLVVALIIVLAAAALTFWLQFTASMRLVAENARTNALLTQIADLSDVQKALSLESELIDYRAEAMATDLEWSELIAIVSAALPADVTVAGFSLAPGGIPQTDEPATEIGVSGTLTLESATVEDIVPLTRALRGAEGVLGVEGWSSVVNEDGVYSYEVRLVVDQSIYTGDFEEESE